MQDRRRFLRNLGMGGAGALATAPHPALAEAENTMHARSADTLPLDGLWDFRTDPEDLGRDEQWFRPETSPSDWDSVAVPHTWQTADETAEYHGAAWYRRRFHAPEEWASCFARLEFEAVYHTAGVWLNGVLLGEHERKGYTAFTLDASPALEAGETNLLVVRAANPFDERMLPRGRSYDWAEDGGITRPVHIHVTPRVFIERIELDAALQPGLSMARIRGRCLVRNTTDTAESVAIHGRIEEFDTHTPVLERNDVASARIEPGGSEWVALDIGDIEAPRLWHFDSPSMYLAHIWTETLTSLPPHRTCTRFGIRDIRVDGRRLLLNGETVRLMGVERMAGSHPAYGMAEPETWLNHDHDDLKELNCVFTRVHWAQDRRVLDYCDENGILIQLEVPTWGPRTFSDQSGRPDPDLLRNGLQQLREMIAHARHHPSVFAWGLCNEIDGTHEASVVFAREMLREAKRLDPHRLCTYASNSLQDPAADRAAALMDFISWNEYYETWYGGTVANAEDNLTRIEKAFPEKMIVISEYGYCECTPDRMGGDAERIRILREHTDMYRGHDAVGGAIFFSYNDYRTHIGDKGLGALQQRVHGVVDLHGRRKPSFEALRTESSPILELSVDVDQDGADVQLETRATLPAYVLRGYLVRVVAYADGGIPVERCLETLPDLPPGTRLRRSIGLQTPAPDAVTVEVLRPTGFAARTARWSRG